MPHIFLDMDGVGVNLHRGIADLLGVKLPAIWPTPGEDNSPVLFGLQSDEIWGRVNAAGASFWENLPPTSLFPSLINLLQQWGHPVTLFTQMAGHKTGGYEGKWRWAQKHVPKDWGFLCSPAKARAMSSLNSNWLLIDDHDENCHEWRMRGGRTLLIPRPWNSSAVRIPPIHPDYLWASDDDILDLIAERLRSL